MVRIITEKQSIKMALKVLGKSKSRLNFKDGRFEVSGLHCQKCSSQIFSVAALISKEEPDGIMWRCDSCGEVDEFGNP